MDPQFMAQLPQVEAMCTALYTAQVCWCHSTNSCAPPAVQTAGSS